MVKRSSKPVKPPAAIAPRPRAAPRKATGDPAALIVRVERAIARELAAIETIIAGKTAALPRGEAEKRARTLATLARTLKEVTRLREEARKKSLDDDTVPRDIDEFRRELSRRLDGLVAAAKAAHPDKS